MSKPIHWPSNLPWDDSYVIVSVLESYPLCITGTRIRGELSMYELKRLQQSKKYTKTYTKKSKRRSRKSKRISRKSRKSRKSKRC